MTKKSRFIFSPSIVSLLLVNLVPLFGIIFWDWDAFTIIILYWLETAVIGFFNALKIKKINKNIFSPWLAFFIVQYAFVLFAYLFLIINIFEVNLGSATEYTGAFKIVFSYLYTLLLSLLFIFISHGISFQYNFINKKEFLVISENKQFLAPYRRLFIMHIIIILAAKEIVYLQYDKTFSAIVFLVILKIIFDLIAHIFEHKKNVAD